MKWTCTVYTHYIYPINSVLDLFVVSWNNHPLSSAYNMTPNQLFIEGALRQNMTPTLTRSSQTGTVPLPASNEAVAVPRSSFSPCDRLVHEIDQYNMLRPSCDLEYSLYRQICDVVGFHLQQCNKCS